VGNGLEGRANSTHRRRRDGAGETGESASGNVGGGLGRNGGNDGEESSESEGRAHVGKGLKGVWKVE
jgi:hypothetical protein